MGHASSRAKKFTITAPKVKQLLVHPTSFRVAKLLKSLDCSPGNSVLHTPPPSLLFRDPGGLTLGPLLHQTQESRLPVDSQNPKHLPSPFKPATNTHTTEFLLFYSLFQKVPQVNPPLSLPASWFLTSMDTSLSLSGNSSKLMRLVPLLLLVITTLGFIRRFLQFLPSRACQPACAM